MRHPVVVDLETKYTFRNTPDHSKLGISVAGIYDYKTDQLSIFEEAELPELFPILENASLIIGYNIDAFDLPVLKGYYPGDITQFKTFDMLKDIKERIGRRISLDSVVRATLDKAKTGHGLKAIQYYREGRIAELKAYCLSDVTLTRELFDFGVKNGEIAYPDEMEKIPIKVDWAKYLQYQGNGDDMSLTLPF